jgi:hypothetical protein
MKKILVALAFLSLVFLNSCYVEGHARHHRHGVGAGAYIH